VLGPHRLLCGNALVATCYAALMAGETARQVITDPPYNVRIDGHVCGKGAIRHGEFAMASGEMTPDEFTAFLFQNFGAVRTVCVDGAIVMVFMDWRHAQEILAAGLRVFDAFKNLCVWVKDNGGMGSFYRSQHELCFVFKVGTAPHVNTFGLGGTGRYRTNVWSYAGINTLRAGRMEELALHPTVKPVAMIADAIRDCSHRNDIILDPFGGSGTLLLAAHRTGRRARVMELDPLYVDTALLRFERATGTVAIHEATGLTFRALAERRAAGNAPAGESA
jgi:DNA modification methylase